jgi:hypothetical protein
VHRTLALVRDLGTRVGVALNPGTPVAVLERILDLVDLALVMSINLGLGGRSFIRSSIYRARAVVGDRPVAIEVDGGVNGKNAPWLAAAGASMLVAGSSLFRGDDVGYASNVAALGAGAVASVHGGSTTKAALWVSGPMRDRTFGVTRGEGRCHDPRTRCSPIWRTRRHGRALASPSGGALARERNPWCSLLGTGSAL